MKVSCNLPVQTPIRNKKKQMNKKLSKIERAYDNTATLFVRSGLAFFIFIDITSDSFSINNLVPPI
ncbi:hypothetical protein C2W64_02557 [Brevibacillus laterosporus]|nr:hypothetical protein C2W64_02557 [Brevibacillus laterosporus]